MSGGKRLRVLYVIPDSPAAKAWTFARQEVEHIARLSHIETMSFYLSSRTSLRQLLLDRGAFREAIREFNPDLVHAHFGTMTSFFCAVSTSLPLVITFRGSDLNPVAGENRVKTAAAHLLSQLSALGARKVICVSRQLVGRLWWGRHKAVVLPNGVDLEMFRPLERDEARRRLGWDPTEKVVLFNASRRPELKGLEFVEKAVERARALVGEVRLLVARGDVPFEQMPLYMSASDCLALASLHEGSPTVVKESMACNLPVVTVDVGDVVERLKGVHPSQVVARDSEAFGAALAEILSQPGVRSNGRKCVAELSLARIARRLYAIYSDI